MHLVYWLDEAGKEIVNYQLLSGMRETPEAIEGFVMNGCWDFLWKGGNIYVGCESPKNYIAKMAKPFIFKVTDKRGDYNRIIYKALDFIKEANETTT